MKTDDEIQKDVMAELRWEPLLNATEIGVAVKNGIVTLSGAVDMYRKKALAERAAKRVDGVKIVAEDIEVRLDPDAKKNDTEIAEALLFVLKWHSILQDEEIKLTVENGWVTLEGEVEWNFQKMAAQKVIENTVGVLGVKNNVKILPHLFADDIQHKIKSAFHRSATVDANKIEVIVEDSTVTLKGYVRSIAEKKDAEGAAWLAPGVAKVVNKLEVQSPVIA